MAIDTRSAAPDEGVDLREYTQMLARSKWLILLTTAFVFGLAGLYSYTRTPLYSSESAVLVRPVLTSALEADQVGALSSQTETQIATSLPVAQAAGAALDWQGTAQELVARVDAGMTEGSGVMFISFTARRPGAAADGANAFA